MTSDSPISALISDRPQFTVRRTFVSDMHNAVYLLTAKSSGEQILIDAADDLPALETLLREGADDVATAAGASAQLRYIVTTHAHWDHTRAAEALRSKTGARIAIGRDDAPQLRAERGVDADVLLEHGDTVEVDGIRLSVISLVGHTPGSVAAATQDGDPTLLFTGDSLFPGGVGNTGDDPERFGTLYRDVTARLFDRFPDTSVVYPGHGNETTLGDERPHLTAWKERGW
ncbi:MAG: MBL fold metallo-hydrolase [Leucobacter sp.]